MDSSQRLINVTSDVYAKLGEGSLVLYHGEDQIGSIQASSSLLAYQLKPGYTLSNDNKQIYHSVQSAPGIEKQDTEDCDLGWCR
ncbi:YusG family protein [Bacillaceae bacterium SIJ1]|uniref:DUF2553 family protein n=1 Tax=Litoribacterium kuwaitense TaxID=1398745 RepID=UPI0013E9D347|nr:DUF2553 family protein [Litoribacterium kuwaitense]NGP46341.1 YusG family protein [Litoribacterium kuwaitense]